MARGVCLAIERVTKQAEIVKEELRQLRRRRERALNAYRKAEDEYRRAKDTAQRNLNKLSARNDDLNVLLGSMAGRPDAEVRDALTLPDLETLTEVSPKIGSSGEGDEVDEEGAPVTELAQPDTRAKATSRSASVSIPSLSGTKTSPANSRQKANRANENGSQFLDYCGGVVNEGDKGDDEEEFAAGRSQSKAIEDDEPEEVVRTRDQRESSVLSNANVERLTSPQATTSATRSPILRGENKKNRDCDWYYATDSESDDGLFVSTRKRFRRLPPEPSSQSAPEPRDGRDDKIESILQSDVEYDDLFGEGISQPIETDIKRGIEQGRKSRSAPMSLRRPTKDTKGQSQKVNPSLDRLVAETVLRRAPTNQQRSSVECTMRSTPESMLSLFGEAGGTLELVQSNSESAVHSQSSGEHSVSERTSLLQRHHGNPLEDSSSSGILGKQRRPSTQVTLDEMQSPTWKFTPLPRPQKPTAGQENTVLGTASRRMQQISDS